MNTKLIGVTLFFLSPLCFAESQRPRSRVDTPALGLHLSQTPNLETDFERGVFDGDERTKVRFTDAPCVLQAESSPSQGDALNAREVRDRFVLGLMGPVRLAAACQQLKRRIGNRKCKRLFLGGHNGSDGVGVLDLFYLHPRKAFDPGTPETLKALRERQAWLAALPTVSPQETRRRAREMLFAPKGPCYPGPLFNEGKDVGGQREATLSERSTFEALLDCFGDLLDRASPEQAVVMSACGPLDDRCIEENRSADTGIGQEVCGRVLADALGTRVFYSRGICGAPITSAAYDTCPYGHRVVVPSNWSEIRPK